MGAEDNRYVPLDGTELLEYLMHEVRERLKSHFLFGIQNAYHNPKIRFAVIIAQRDREDTHTDYESKASFEDIPTVLEPDRVRELLGLGIYKVVEKGGVLVDEKQVEEKRTEMKEKFHRATKVKKEAANHVQ